MSEQAEPRRETVVLLHGILDSGMKMRGMERYLKKEGFDTLNISYPSTAMALEDLADYLHEKLSMSGAFNGAAQVHFVAHSMGGLLTRYYLHKYRPDHLGRVVMGGTPNNGSEFADYMSTQPVLRPAFEKIFGPAGSQLRVAHRHDESMTVDYELGVIAGSQSFNPLSPLFLPGDNDGTVSVASTRIDGMADHIVLPAGHTFMMFYDSVQEQAAHFLRHGRFAREKTCHPSAG